MYSDNENTYCNTNGECLYIQQQVPLNNLIENFGSTTEEITPPTDLNMIINSLITKKSLIDILIRILYEIKPYFKNIPLYTEIDNHYTDATNMRSNIQNILDAITMKSINLLDLINKTKETEILVNNINSRSTSTFRQIMENVLRSSQNVENRQNAQIIRELLYTPDVNPLQYALLLLSVIRSVAKTTNFQGGMPAPKPTTGVVRPEFLAPGMPAPKQPTTGMIAPGTTDPKPPTTGMVTSGRYAPVR